MNPLTDFIDYLLGRGRHSTTVPVMDGPLQPNQLLEEAALLAQADEADHLCVQDDRLLFASGTRVLEATLQGSVEWLQCEAPVASLAAHSGGAVAIGLDGRGVSVRGGAHDGRRIEQLEGQPLTSPTALCFADADTLFVAQGAAGRTSMQWKHDLMDRGQSGSVWRIDLRSGTAIALARGLAWPYGLALRANGALLVSEAWRYRLLEIAPVAGAVAQPVLEDLPAYPARLLPAAEDGYWLALFAPRNPLVEFVLRERAYRERMIAQVDPRYWIAPKLAARQSYREPLQGGAIKEMGMLKPWAPTFSYGLVVRLDARLQPVASLHSRSDGSRHGTTALALWRGRLVVAARGPGQLLLPALPSGVRP